MQQWAEIRRRVLVDGVSKRQILRETGMHWRTLEKILATPRAAGLPRHRPRARPKLGPYLDRIAQILEDDKQAAPGSSGTPPSGSSSGCAARATRAATPSSRRPSATSSGSGREVFVPLVHRPGEAQVDFGQAVVNVAGRLRKVAFFVMTLPHSDAIFVQAFERECTETFREGHVRGLRLLRRRARGGSPTTTAA